MMNKMSKIYGAVLVMILLLGQTVCAQGNVIVSNSTDVSVVEELLEEDNNAFSENNGYTTECVSMDLLTNEIDTYSVTSEVSSDGEQIIEGYSGISNETNYPNVSLFQLVGKDDRIVVDTPTQDPYSHVCYIEYTYANGTTTSATAWLAGPSIAVTSAHCVYDAGKGGWIKSMRVYPGYKKGQTPPFGSANVTKMHVYNAWINVGGARNDFAILELDNAIGNKAGYFGFACNTSILNKNVRVTGYPGKFKGIMKTAKDIVSDEQTKYFIYHTDTESGQSGSPAYRGSIVYGVHSRSHGSYNVAYRITEETYNWILSFR